MEGIVLVILGLLAILLPQIAIPAVYLLVGWVLLIAGGVGLYTTFQAKSAPGFWWALISAGIAIIAGVLLLILPLTRVSLLMVLVAFFLIEGICSVMYAIEHRRELTSRWGWMLARGIITLALAFLTFLLLTCPWPGG